MPIERVMFILCSQVCKWQTATTAAATTTAVVIIIIITTAKKQEPEPL